MTIELDRKKATFTLDMVGENDHVAKAIKIFKALSDEISFANVIKLKGVNRDNAMKLHRVLAAELGRTFRAVAFAEYEDSKFVVLTSSAKEYIPETELK